MMGKVSDIMTGERLVDTIRTVQGAMRGASALQSAALDRLLRHLDAAADGETLPTSVGVPGDRFVCTPEQRETSAFLLAAEKAGWTKDQVIEAQRGDVERLYRAHVEKALKAPPEPIRIDLPEKVFSFARQVLANELEALAGRDGRHVEAFVRGIESAAEHLRKAPEPPPWTAEMAEAMLVRWIDRCVARDAQDLPVLYEIQRERQAPHRYNSALGMTILSLKLFGAIDHELLPYLPSLIEKDATR